MQHIILMRNAAFCVVLCLALVPTAHAGIETLLQCAQKYPDSEIERLKCYDQLVASGPPAIPVVAEIAVPDEKTKAGSIPAIPFDVSPKGNAERTYFTRA